ncbi:GLPGLI family protein [Chitinophaga skermanii]|uniref:GLPGLI family protein n=1 Tax=Chitinophaga skermanii TaxID=331697 RepID=A0A327R357_9BACT|nr:GLPGLI family protein [Chitinophaga skermanii]RAJ08317.1 GLPGLI family protein [Chitinophaga skermanii]
MKKISSLILLIILQNSLLAQVREPVQAGSITFERKIQAHKLVQEMAEKGGMPQENADKYKAANPAFNTSYFKLEFNQHGALYKPAEKAGMPSDPNEWFKMVGYDNEVLTQKEQGSAILKKSVFGNSFLVLDSLHKIRWKITLEMREIAGFQCRRANALVLDSVYVVAYFAPDIMSESGPESYSGLPGIILGLALPYEHVTWFATSVSITPPDEKEWKQMAAKQAINKTEYLSKISAMVASWRDAGGLVIRKASL